MDNTPFPSAPNAGPGFPFAQARRGNGMGA